MNLSGVLGNGDSNNPSTGSGKRKLSRLLKRGNPEIPTASMADIAFLLIIYFMVTTTFAATRGLDFSLPKEDNEQPMVEKEEAVLVEVQPSDVYIVDGNPMVLEKIFEYLRPKLEVNPQKPIIVRTSEDASYGGMVGVLDELRPIKYKLEGRQVVVRQFTTKEIQEADDEELRDEGWRDLNVSIPTQREIQMFWY